MPLSEADIYWNKTVHALHEVAALNPKLQQKFWKQCPVEKKNELKRIVNILRTLGEVRTAIKNKAIKDGNEHPSYILPFPDKGYQINLQTMMREEIPHGDIQDG